MKDKIEQIKSEGIQVKQVAHKSIVGYGKIFFGEMYRVFNKEGKRLFTLEFEKEPTEEKLYTSIWNNLYNPVLPF